MRHKSTKLKRLLPRLG